VTAPPYADTYAAYTPYITMTEFLNSATGVDWSQLVPGANTATNQVALVTKIQRASSYADVKCKQVLAATAQIEQMQVTADRWGRYLLHPRQWPVLQLTSASITPIDGGAPIVANTASAIIERTRIILPTTATLSGSSAGPLQFGSIGPLQDGYAQFGYVAGWPNTILTATATAGAAAIQVQSALGIYAGSVLTIYDGVNTETVTVASTYTSGTTLPLTAGLLYTHTYTAGVQNNISVSALPPALKEAIVLLTTALIKVRGAEAFAMAQIREQPQNRQKMSPGGITAFDVVDEILAEFRAMR
jgi:hypothetical protein